MGSKGTAQLFTLTVLPQEMKTSTHYTGSLVGPRVSLENLASAII
jgi:hypothetical protein